jgi:tRNA(Ile)-lysidine synthase
MINIQGKLDREVYVAASGGVDSMAVVDFLSRSHDVTIMFFDHHNDFAKEEKQFLIDYTTKVNPKVKLEIEGSCWWPRNKEESLEEYWRNMRYDWFHSFDFPIITCHHLDDCIENWIFSSLHGEGKIIPYANKNVIRPFRSNKKTEFINWCRNKNVPWIEDESNEDTSHMRNFIRHEIVPKALVVNPGLHKVIRKKVLEDGPKAS